MDRDAVRERASRRCEYCRIHEDDDIYSFHLEHVIPRKLGGRDDDSNLAWSCHNCNLAKGASLSGYIRGEVVPIFHPRRHRWNRHFQWVGAILTGRTKRGQATVQVLNMNTGDRVKLREILIAAGMFPPA